MIDDALSQARAMLNDLTEAARKGQIIPVRLTGQLEAILDMVDQAQEKQRTPQPVAASPDVETYRRELAEMLSHGFHDLRLPLTSIRGYSDMLVNPAMGELNAMQQQFVSTIRANSRRMESLLMDVSDMSKIRAGTLKVTPKMDMFKNIALMVEKQMRPVADELGRSLTFEIPSGLPILNVDSEILAKALNKIVENALRYIEVENGAVKVSASQAGKELQIHIQDNGIGINAEELAKLGTPYFRGDHEVVLKHKGSGLGLPIAYGILGLLGSSVTVDTEPGKGTTFTVAIAGMS